MTRDLFGMLIAGHSIDPVLPKTGSTREAMAVLTEHRRRLIAYGRYVATEVCRVHMTTHSRDVRRGVAKAGLLTADIGDFWLGAVFHNSRFEWTGHFHVYSDESRNIHERTIKVWRLPDDMPGYDRPVDTPEYKWSAA